MTTVSKKPLLRGAAVLILAIAFLYGCKDFLSSASAPQGTLNQTTLANRAGVEGSLIAAYRTLDCTDATSGNWGCAASNWVWGSIPGGDSYKGSDIGDQPNINDVEGYHWGSPLQFHASPPEIGSGLESIRIFQRGFKGDRGRSHFSASALPLRGLADVGQHPLLPRGRNGFPQAE